MLFVAVDQKLNDAVSNSEIRVIFDPEFKAAAASTGVAQTYDVTGTTVRTGLSGRFRNSIRRRTRRRCCMWPGACRGVRLSLIGRRWIDWGDGRDRSLGMAAAELEQRVGHKAGLRVCWDSRPTWAFRRMTGRCSGRRGSMRLRNSAGPAEVRKLYSAKMTKLDLAEVTKALGTTSTELERKWQMWMYAYIAGMPPAGHSMAMPMAK